MFNAQWQISEHFRLVELKNTKEWFVKSPDYVGVILQTWSFTKPRENDSVV